MSSSISLTSLSFFSFPARLLWIYALYRPWVPCPLFSFFFLDMEGERPKRAKTFVLSNEVGHARMTEYVRFGLDWIGLDRVGFPLEDGLLRLGTRLCPLSPFFFCLCCCWRPLSVCVFLFFFHTNFKDTLFVVVVVVFAALYIYTSRWHFFFRVGRGV